MDPKTITTGHLTTEARDIAALGDALSIPRSALPPANGCSTPFVIVPAGYQLQDLERLLPVPARPKGKRNLTDADSFIRFVAQNKGAATRLYCSTGAQPSFTAVFNDTTAAAPGWGDHVAAYSCPLSPEWKTWTGANGKHMSQEVFATFVEDNAPDCASPTAADMLEISRTLEAKKKVNFASSVRLDNGQAELVYEETIQGTASKGKLQVPQVFTVGIPVFEGGERYAVEARLRYRIGDGGNLTLWFDLLRPHKIIEDALKELRTVIETRTELPAFCASA